MTDPGPHLTLPAPARRPMRLGLTLPVEEGLSARQLMALAGAARDGGYDTILAGEVSGPDVFALLAAVSTVAGDLRLGTGVVPTTTRSLPLLTLPAPARRPMRLGLTLPVEEGLSARQLMALAGAARDGGYDTILAGEVSGPDVFALLAAVSTVAGDLRLGTGVVPTTTRSLPLLAMGFATLASLAPGRVLAGIGVSSRTVVEGWHGRPFPKPIGSMREFVPAFRAALTGARVDLDGEGMRVEGFRLSLPVAEAVPVMLAAMNPRMLRLAGALGDAVQLTWCPPDEVPGLIDQVHAGAREVGRDPAEVEIVASFFGYGGPDTEAALERYRRFVLAYALQGTHREAFRGSIPEIDEADRRWRARDRAGALALVSDAAVHRLCAVGASAVAQRTRALYAAGVDTPVLLPAGARTGDFDGSLATVTGLAAGLAGAS